MDLGSISYSDSNQSLRLLYRIMTPLTYEVKGCLTVDTVIRSQDLPDLFRRSAVIMATHLFHSVKPYCFRRIMSSYIASHLNRTMNEEILNRAVAVMIPQGLTLQLYSVHYIVIPELKPGSKHLYESDMQKFENKEDACMEFAFDNKYFAVVSYSLSVACQPGNDQKLKLSQQPHFSWDEMVRQVIDAHQNSQSPVLSSFYSGTLADRALSRISGQSMTYLENLG